MKTELEHLRVCLILALRSSEHSKTSDERETQITGSIRDAIRAFDCLQERYENLQSQTPPEWQNTSWFLTVSAATAFHSGAAEIFARALRQLPWPQGIVVRFSPAEERGGHQHEFCVHHESVDVGGGMRVIE
jgi:hypothetical protein